MSFSKTELSAICLLGIMGGHSTLPCVMLSTGVSIGSRASTRKPRRRTAQTKQIIALWQVPGTQFPACRHPGNQLPVFTQVCICASTGTQMNMFTFKCLRVCMCVSAYCGSVSHVW